MPPLAIIWRAARSSDLLATSVDSVIEVLPPLAWRSVPAVPPWVRGLFAYRTRLIPMVDMARLLGFPSNADRMANRVLVVRAGPDQSMHGWPIGLWVDSVLDLDRIDFSATGSHPGFEVDAARFLGPVAQTRWGPVQLIKPAVIFTPEQMDLLTLRMVESAGATSVRNEGVGAA